MGFTSESARGDCVAVMSHLVEARRGRCRPFTRLCSAPVRCMTCSVDTQDAAAPNVGPITGVDQTRSARAPRDAVGIEDPCHTTLAVARTREISRLMFWLWARPTWT